MKISEKAAAESTEPQREQNRQIATQLQQDFERRAEGLESEIRQRARVSDPSHVAYSMCEEITLYLKTVHTPSEERSEEPCAA